MGEQSGKRPRRRRSRRGGQDRSQRGDAAPQSPDSAPAHGEAPRPEGRGPRQDNRGRGRADRPPGAAGPPGPPGAAGGGRTHRSPSATGRPPARERERPQRAERDRDRGPRVVEAAVPQDERSIELGAAFKEAQILMRDARKALAKRKAEFGDEPDWMLEQLAAAGKRFEEAASAWTEHLETTGRKVVRGDRR